MPSTAGSTSRAAGASSGGPGTASDSDDRHDQHDDDDDQRRSTSGCATHSCDRSSSRRRRRGSRRGPAAGSGTGRAGRRAGSTAPAGRGWRRRSSVNTMNCSRLTARTAGIESTAKITSVGLDEDEHREQRRGQPLAVDLREQLLPVVVASVRRHDPVARACRTRLLLGSTWSSSSDSSSRTAVKSRNAPKTKSIQSNRVDQRDAGEDERSPAGRARRRCPRTAPGAGTSPARRSS